MRVDYLKSIEDPVSLIESAAATCYNTNDYKKGTILKHCYNSGHHSVLEFADFTFRVDGISRAAANQLVRHRIASYAQRSQRYCLEDNSKNIIPQKILNRSDAKEEVENFYKLQHDLYLKLINEHKIPIEDARYILSNSHETTIYVKMNLRSLTNFFNERLCATSQWEIRKLAKIMRSELIQQHPEIDFMLVPKCEKDPSIKFCSEPERKWCGRQPHRNMGTFYIP